MQRSFRLGLRNFISGVLVSIMLAPLPSIAAAPAPATERVMPQVIQLYTADASSIDKTYRISFAPITLARFDKFYKDELTVLDGMDFDHLSSQEDRVDYVLLKTHVIGAQHQLALHQRQAKEMEPLLPFAPSIETFIDDKRRMVRPDGEKTAAALTDIVRKIEAAQKAFDPKNPKAQKFDPIVANRAVQATLELQTELKVWYDQYNSYDPLFTWWDVLPYKDADKALTGYAAFLKDKLIGIAPDDKTTIIGDPVGRDALIAELHDNLIPYTPEELIAIAQTEYDWSLKEMIKASREMGYGDNWHAAVEKIKTMHAQPGEEPELIRRMVLDGSDFVEKNDLVTIPPLADETWRMIMMTPQRQLVNPFFTGGNEISVSFPTDTMTYDQREMSMRGNSEPLDYVTAFHEMIPGHFMQFYSSARYNTYRKEFSTPFWGEGNSFWWEMLLYDKGFDNKPEYRVAAMMWRMHRSARIITTMNFHLGKMTPQQCVQYIIDNVGWEPDNATAEVRRYFNGSVGPLYQASYMLGALQLRQMHKELVDSGKMTDKQFHDTVLHENSMPIELLRADMENLPLSKNFTTSWKFYGEHPTHP